jgi:phytoene dehydrogenase-like protein
MPDAAPGQDFDVIVIGGGVNGLVCAVLLAQARKRVIVLEAQDRLGGMCRTDEIAPGFRVSTVAHLVGPLDAEVMKTLRLAKLGLQFSARQTGAVALSPDGRHIILGEDLRHTAQSLAVHDAGDAKAWPAYATGMRRAAQQLHAWTQQAAVPAAAGEASRSSLLGGRPRQSAPDAQVAAQLELSIAELLDRNFVTPLLKGAIAFDAVLGNAFAPAAAGSAVLPVLRRALEPHNATGVVHPVGGAGALVATLQKAAEAAGVRVRLGARADQYLFESGRIAGVHLSNGDAVYAPHVVSSLSPLQTYLRMGAERDLPLGFKRQLQGYRMEGAVAKVNFALNGPPTFKNLDKRYLKERLLVCLSMNELARSHAAFEQGQLSTELALEVTLPSVHDASLARAGCHVMSVNATYVPSGFGVNDGEQARTGLVTAVLNRLRQFAPDLPDLVAAVDVYLPVDLAALGGGAGCHWHGGDLSPDQLGALRPAFWAGAPAPVVPGLHLCGAGTHPCGGVTGTNGRLAAEAVLRSMQGGA